MDTVGPWAKQKLGGLEAYLGAYTTALKYQSFKLVYIDAFAGTGKSKLRNEWSEGDDAGMSLFDDEKWEHSEEQFIKGSPRIALELKNPFHRYFFFDNDSARTDLLKELKAEYPEHEINIEVGDGNKLIESLAPELNVCPVRGVAFLDPYGPHLKWSTVEALGRTGKFEVIINFPLGMAINRLITRSMEIRPEWKQMLNDCFGGGEWEELVYRETTDLFGTERSKSRDAQKRLLDFYVKKLGESFKHVAEPRVVRNTRRVPIYYMLWAGPHQLGHKIAEHILGKGERLVEG